MKILTVNLPVTDLKKIEKLVGVLYPSRSELIRVAVREFLIKEISMAKDLKEQPSDEEIEKIKDLEAEKTGYVRIPYDEQVGDETIRSYKILKLIHKTGEQNS